VEIKNDSFLKGNIRILGNLISTIGPWYEKTEKKKKYIYIKRKTHVTLGGPKKRITSYQVKNIPNIKRSVC